MAYGDPERLDDPAVGADEITPDDAAELAHPTRGLYVGGGGDVTVRMAAGGATVTFAAVPAGTILPIRVTKVLATGTAATNLVGLW